MRELKAKIVYVALAFLMAVVLMLAAVPIAVTGVVIAQGPTPVYISPASQTVSPGQVFTVDIYVEPAVAIMGVSAVLNFNPALLTADSCVEGDLLNQNGGPTFFPPVIIIDNVAGSIGPIDGAVLGATVSGPGAFATITFTAKETAGTSTLDLSGVLVRDGLNNPVVIDVTGGDVTIDEAATSACFISPASQTVSPGQVFTVDIFVEPAEPIVGVQAGLSFDPSLVTANSWAEGDLLNQNGDFTMFWGGTINNSTGTITPIGGGILGGDVSSPGSFVTITFTAGETTGTSPLVLTWVMASAPMGVEADTTPTDGDVTIAEGGDGGEGGCFIATAAYGTEAAEEIDVLRAFRDEVLLESAVGSQLVEWYYQTSPPVADFISENDVLRTLVRELVIDPMVSVATFTQGIWGK
jgi:hypothetical protein